MLDHELKREQAEAGAPHRVEYGLPSVPSAGAADEMLGDSVVEVPAEGVEHPLPAQDEEPPPKG